MQTMTGRYETSEGLAAASQFVHEGLQLLAAAESKCGE